MIQTQLACPKCGSPHQQRSSGNKYSCESCHTFWFAEGPENPPPPETPELQEEPVLVVKPPSIKVHQYLRSKGYLVGVSWPSKTAENWWFLTIFEEQPPIPAKGFLGKVSYYEQEPRNVARIHFGPNQWEKASENHWILEFWGESRTEKMTALAHELAAQFNVRIFAVLMES